MRNNFLAILFLLTVTLFTPQKTFAQEKASHTSAQLSGSEASTKLDNRAKVLGNFLKVYKSPLATHAAIFVNEADKNRLDWRLLVAISGVESTFGRRIPHNSYNGWGWGIYGTNAIYFKSWDEAIETISKGLRQAYMDKWGAENVYEIGRYYAASPTWASRVTYFMNQIDYFAAKNRVETLPISL